MSDTLSISVKSVETQKAKAMEKLGLSSTSDLIRWAQSSGLLEAR
ncbi:LuxR C-terminal-related transcriptional regulator [Streptomyces syringium]